MTREHVFRSSWKRKIDTREYLLQLPGVDRKFIQYNLDGSTRHSKLEDLFSVVIKRVCATCNNEWMNDLDSIVEPWVFDPDNDDNRCDPRVFRRWAIKVALLRIYYDEPLLIEPADPPRIFAGDDIPDWHVFVGHMEIPEHRHALCGVGPFLVTVGGKAFGVTQVSWTLGYSLVTALRIHGDHEWSTNCLRNFKHYNRLQNVIVHEILPSATEMPSVRSLPALSRDEVQTLVWLFSPHPTSPMADEVRKSNEGTRALAKELGIEWGGKRDLGSNTP
ncbi:hypothetical protein ACNQQN_22375 [Mycobacteroides chelonae]|uniref:hypothetical protein n=1 Tax=Mycobacteroides chelonae TaxID=1774 RepID=UPI0010422FEE|nr:hypothetical protein [Mycobacteroides chelonae]MBF9522613.1 hypothetical protein [Mycobacteroides chelonae]